jgi:hypothetical protein
MWAGDAMIFPHGDAHVLSSDEHPEGRQVRVDAAPARHRETVRLGGGPEAARDTTFVCGFLGCDVRPFNPLLAALPRVRSRSDWLALTYKVTTSFRRLPNVPRPSPSHSIKPQSASFAIRLSFAEKEA